MFQKGDIVKIKGYVEREYKDGNRVLIHHKITTEFGIVLGYSFLRTGVVKGGGGWEDWEPPYLAYPLDHKVWVVEPTKGKNRYLIPYRCYEEDLEIIR